MRIQPYTILVHTTISIRTFIPTRRSAYNWTVLGIGAVHSLSVFSRFRLKDYDWPTCLNKAQRSEKRCMRYGTGVVQRCPSNLLVIFLVITRLNVLIVRPLKYICIFFKREICTFALWNASHMQKYIFSKNRNALNLRLFWSSLSRLPTPQVK